MKNIDISIISINYNNSQLTLDFIKSVTLYSSKNYIIEFIIVDNCSIDEDYENLKLLLSTLTTKNIKLIRSNINLGFGGGNMLGTQNARGEYLAYLNNDIIFTEDCFSTLINFFKNNPTSAVCTPQQYSKNNQPTSCFDYFHGIRKELFGRKFVELTSKKPKRENIHYTKNLSVDFIQGCFMFFRANIFAEIGGFDTNLFLYYEEMDICYRLKKIGYTSNLVPRTSFKHLHGASTKKSIVIQKELKISQLYISKKNQPFLKHTIIRAIILMKLVFKPKKWSFINLLITGKYLENSLKHQQKIHF